ncbi:hypothetical protein PTMSG1_07334 [Pyrenophora teres f. maculata]|nr:hypothetical protein PTMSG1_07334 [Pyrenophora teres f. maculata]
MGHKIPLSNPAAAAAHKTTAAPNTLQLNAYTRRTEIFSFAPYLISNSYHILGWSITITFSCQFLLMAPPLSPQNTQGPLSNMLTLTFSLTKNVDSNGMLAPTFSKEVQITVTQTPNRQPCVLSSLFVENTSKIDLHIKLEIRQIPTTLTFLSLLLFTTVPQQTLEWVFDADKGYLAPFALLSKKLKATHIIFYPEWHAEFLPGGVVPDEAPFPQWAPGAKLAAMYPGMRFVKLPRGNYCSKVERVSGELWRLLAVGTVDV